MAKRKQYDPEFHIPGEPETRENPTPVDVAADRYRPSDAGEEAPTGHEYSPPPEEDATAKKEKGLFRNAKGRFIIEMAAAMMAVVVVKDAYGYDLLGHDIFNGSRSASSVSVSVSEPEPEPPEDRPNYAYWPADDIPDTEFPILPNQEPNGYVPGYGIINEQYVRIEHYDTDLETPDYLYCVDGVWNTTGEYLIDEKGLHLENGEVVTDYYYAPDSDYDTEYAKISDRQGITYYNGKDFLFYVPNDPSDTTPPAFKRLPIGPVEGAYYDEATNTLTLNNFNDPNAVLNVNLMGNGFKIKLVGKNYLRGILAWGFYYGGSITFTGDGYLNVDSGSGSKAIVLRAEESQSCIMVEETAKLDINGGYGAIMIYDSLCEKGLYYKGQMYHDAAYEGVHRAFGPFAARENGNEKCYSVVDKYNSPMTGFTINYIEDPYDYDYDGEY